VSEVAIPRAAVSAAPARRTGTLDGFFILLVAVGLWQFIAVWTQGIAISPPLATFVYVGNLALTASFWANARETFFAFATSFVIAAVLGLLLGLVLGLRRFAGDVAEPILAGFYTIPKVTLYPVVLLIFGLGMSAKVAFGVLHGLVPVTLFTLGAIKTLPPVLMRAARTMRLSSVEAMRWVLIPACLPEIVAGLRIGFSLTFLGVLIGEMFSSQRGLGFLLVNGLSQHNVKLTTSVVFLIVVAAIMANTLMLRLARRVTHRT
jgi:NitT/TauT family transport system permease protein